MGGKAAALALALGALAGCGGATPSPMPGSMGAPPPGDVDALSRDLESQERELAQSLGGPPPPSANTAPGGAVPDTDNASTATPPAQPAAEASGSPCATACRALASMRRSADRICEITGPGAERCGWAREKVRDAEARVARAACAC
jgi:hypothetical protein